MGFCWVKNICKNNQLMGTLYLNFFETVKKVS